METGELLLTRRAPPLQPQRRLTIGLVNNMPDAALCATERQFGDLLRAAAGETAVELRFFALAGVERGERALAAMAGRYEPAASLAGAGLDGLIVTGAEPRAARLEDEPFWPALARLADWARDAAMPTVWSCLAAHAAVLHYDGVERRRLPAKLSGVFQSARVSSDPLVAGGRDDFTAPHSRLNGLAEDDLAARGYEVLTRSPHAGVDVFVRRGRALGLFLQGHPEYEAETLMREYGRDVGRFLRGERPVHPAVPIGYFDPEIEARLEALAERSRERPSPDRLAAYADILASAAPQATWRASAIRLYRGWLAEVAGAGALADRSFRRAAG